MIPSNKPKKFFSIILRPRHYALLIGCGVNEEQMGVKKILKAIKLDQSAKE